jgi:putative glutamine amidotransferase
MQNKHLILLFFLPFYLFGHVKVAISKNADPFVDWLKNVDPEIEIIDLYHLPNGESENVLRQCSGLILSGGPDVHPALYGKPEKLSLCYVDTERDLRERMFIQIALELELPLLAICRGFHLLNVICGGTLIADIPTEIRSEVIHRQDKELAYHSIFIEENSLLRKLSSTTIAFVNSNHHQAIDLLAPPFLSSAHSRDQMIEAFEWKDKSRPFLLAVEWHPEYMTSPFSKHIAETFLHAMALPRKK